MKNLFLILSLLSLLQRNTIAQLTLESLDGEEIVTVPAGTEIGLKMPTWTAKDICDCHEMSMGVLQTYRLDTITMAVTKKERRFYPENQLAQKEVTEYKYLGRIHPNTPIVAKDALSVTTFPKSKKALQGTGAFLITLSVLHGLVTAPLLAADDRKVSDKIVWAGIGVGVTLMIMPGSKTYYFQQEKGKAEKLWRIVER